MAISPFKPAIGKSWRKHYLYGRGRVMQLEPDLEFADKTKRFVKAELKRANVTYEELARRLSSMGVPETRVSIASKMSRGAFSATFFLSVMKSDRKANS
jgi:hypothetical protein